MDIQALLKHVEDDLLLVEKELEGSLQSPVEMIPEVGRYMIMSGGKRLRPIMLLLVTRLAGYTGGHHIRLASVVEFIHTATLLHDDVVDSADLRRGMTSANSVWGSEASILIGDFLYSKSFSMAVDCDNIRVLKVLSDATTVMAQGMVFELIKTNNIETSEEDYFQLIIDKTAALIAATCQVGAILGGLSEEKEKALWDYGMNLGIAFQLMDDSMDYVSTEEDFGKTIGTDLQEGKVTLPFIKALSECTNEEKETMTRLLGSEGLDKKDLNMALGLINKYKGIEYTTEKAGDYILKAKNNLQCFDDSVHKENLMNIATYVLERDS